MTPGGAEPDVVGQLFPVSGAGVEVHGTRVTSPRERGLADIAMVLRYETDGTATVLGCWCGSVVPAFIGTRLTVAGEGVAVSVRRTGQPARATRFAGPPGSVADWLRRAGMRAVSGSPVVVSGRLWGAVITATRRPGQLPPDAEHRLARSPS